MLRLLAGVARGRAGGLATGAALVLLLRLWVHPTSPVEGAPGGPLEPDSVHYLAMVEGPLSAAPPPFSYRVGVPLLARGLVTGLGLTSLDALHALTLLGLVLACAAVWGAGRRLGHAPLPLALALATSASAPVWVYALRNPFLTDAPALAALSGALAAWLSGGFALALAALVGGTLLRETVAVAGALWLVPERHASRAASRARWLRAPLALALCAGVVAATHALPGMEPAPGPLATVGYVLERKGTVRILGDALGSWHFLWALAGLGLWLAPPERRARLAPPAALLVLSAAGFSLVALNTGRMFAFAFPAVALLLAEVFALLVRAGRTALALGLAATCLAGVPLWAPVWLLEGVPAFRGARGVYALLLLVPVLLAARAARREALEGGARGGGALRH
jgi:hypothetical protein